MKRWPRKRPRRDPLACPKGHHQYEVPSTYPPEMLAPGTPGVVATYDCHCPASSPGHIHWARVQ